MSVPVAASRWTLVACVEADGWHGAVRDERQTAAYAVERKRVLAGCTGLVREHIPLREVLVALVANDRA